MHAVAPEPNKVVQVMDALVDVRSKEVKPMFNDVEGSLSPANNSSSRDASSTQTSSQALPPTSTSTTSRDSFLYLHPFGAL
jgi:hypothetical protein